MKILHISDIHGKLSTVKLLCSKISKNDFDVIVVSGDIEDEDTLKILDENFSKPILAVTGNMDPTDIPSKISKYLVENKLFEYQEFTFFGLPPSENTYIELPSSKNLILISHYPPYGTDVDKSFIGTHIGSKLVRFLVEKYKPILVLCGHVHEARGTCKLNSTIIVNPGPLKRGYYALIEVMSNLNINVYLKSL